MGGLAVSERLPAPLLAEKVSTASPWMALVTTTLVAVRLPLLAMNHFQITSRVRTVY